MENLKDILILVIFWTLVIMTSLVGKKIHKEYKLYRIKNAFIAEYKRYRWELRDNGIFEATKPKQLKIPYIKKYIGSFTNNTELRQSFLKAGYKIREIFESYEVYDDFETEEIFAEIRKLSFSKGEVTNKDLLF